MNAVSKLQFQSVQFDITDINGQPWLRGYQIGNALEYSDGAVAIAKLYDRNADEFTDSMTQVIELQTAGGKQQVRIFNLRGCHLLGMLARTKAAKDFRRWVLDILEKETQPRKQKALPSGLSAEQRDEVQKMHKMLLQSVPFEKQKGLSIAMWSALRSKFKMSYKDVPAEQFPEILSLMARVAVEKGAQYREQAALELETVPKLFANQANIPFDLARETSYMITVRGGKIYRHSIMYATNPHWDAQIPALAHMI